MPLSLARGLLMRAALRWLRGGCSRVISLFLGGAPALGVGLSATAIPAEAQTATRTHVVVVTGVSGEPSYKKSFHEAATSILDAARRAGIPDSLALYVAEDPTITTGRATLRSTRENVERALTSVADRARPGEQVLIVLIGHGSAQEGAARFNLPGPDLAASDYARLLGRLTSQTVALVNAASASGDFVQALSGKDRIIITATKSGSEKNEVVFPRYFAAALAGEGADADKDGRVSLLEAFTYARLEVQRSYEQNNRLMTEHALLDDNGDGKGTSEAGERAADGPRARAFFLSAGRAATIAAAANDPRAARLLEDKRVLEVRIDSLRANKGVIAQAEYDRSLEGLLVRLAETNRELRALEGKKP